MDVSDVHGRARELSHIDPGVTNSLDTRPLFIEGVIAGVIAAIGSDRGPDRE